MGSWRIRRAKQGKIWFTPMDHLALVNKETQRLKLELKWLKSSNAPVWKSDWIPPTNQSKARSELLSALNLTLQGARWHYRMAINCLKKKKECTKSKIFKMIQEKYSSLKCSAFYSAVLGPKEKEETRTWVSGGNYGTSTVIDFPRKNIKLVSLGHIYSLC